MICYLCHPAGISTGTPISWGQTGFCPHGKEVFASTIVAGPVLEFMHIDTEIDDSDSSLTPEPVRRSPGRPRKVS